MITADSVFLPKIWLENGKSLLMQKTLFIKLLLSSAAIFLLAVNFSGQKKAQTENWIDFQSEDESFSVKFPNAPDKLEFGYEGEQGKGFRYVAQKDGNTFYVFSYPKVVPPKSAGDENISPWFVETQQQTDSVFDKYKVKTEEIRVGQFKATIAQLIEQKGNPATNVHRILNVAAEDRLLSFRVINKFGDDPEPGEKFFESIRLGSKKTILFPKNSDVISNSVVEKERSSGSGTGSGAGSGSGGIGSGSGNKIIQKNSNQKLKILSLPKPEYTVLAKYYRVAGKVLLRVQFLSDSNIGDVSVISNLPFGLVESAKEAARRIRFEPEHVDGKAVTVTKVLQFDFSY